MTCIVGYVDNENSITYIGGDSAGVSGLNVSKRKDTKVFTLNEKFIIGYTSSFRMGQILRFSFEPPEINDKDLFKYMCTDFIDELRKVFKRKGYLHISNNEETGGTFLVGVKNRLFQISSDLQVSEQIKNYDSCGCGEYYALGSLYSNQSKDALYKVEKALECASEFSGGVAPPFNILTLKH